jgi:hypothetical protein
MPQGRAALSLSFLLSRARSCMCACSKSAAARKPRDSQTPHPQAGVPKERTLVLYSNILYYIKQVRGRGRGCDPSRAQVPMYATRTGRSLSLPLRSSYMCACSKSAENHETLKPQTTHRLASWRSALRAARQQLRWTRSRAWRGGRTRASLGGRWARGWSRRSRQPCPLSSWAPPGTSTVATPAPAL